MGMRVPQYTTAQLWIAQYCTLTQYLKILLQLQRSDGEGACQSLDLHQVISTKEEINSTTVPSNTWRRSLYHLAAFIANYCYKDLARINWILLKYGAKNYRHSFIYTCYSCKIHLLRHVWWRWSTWDICRAPAGALQISSTSRRQCVINKGIPGRLAIRYC